LLTSGINSYLKLIGVYQCKASINMFETHVLHVVCESAFTEMY